VHGSRGGSSGIMAGEAHRAPPPERGVAAGPSAASAAADRRPVPPRGVTCVTRVARAGPQPRVQRGAAHAVHGHAGAPGRRSRPLDTAAGASGLDGSKHLLRSHATLLLSPRRPPPSIDCYWP
jgi:hypothetical protein